MVLGDNPKTRYMILWAAKLYDLYLKIEREIERELEREKLLFEK